MTTRTSVQQSLAALVACDQAYFESGQVNPGDSLAVLPDGPATPNPNPALYTDSPAFSIPAGYTVAAVIERAEIGAKALILQNAAKDTIVAFGGTDGLNAQDYVANSQSYGWSQWSKLNESKSNDDKGVTAWLQANQADSGTIQFAGQSLGGALAQYAIYDYVASQRASNPDYIPSNIALSTFNGLGGEAGLRAKYASAYDPSLLAGLGQVAHYVVDGDIVARLGGGHIGANGEVIRLDWTYEAGTYQDRPMSVGDAHRIETAFYTHLDATGAAFAGGTVITERSTAFPLVDTPNAVYWAKAFGDLGNANQTVDSLEAAFRLVAGVLGSAMVTDGVEINAVMKLWADTQYRAGQLSYINHALVESGAFGAIVQSAARSPLGIAAYLESFAAANLLDALKNLPSINEQSVLDFLLGVSGALTRIGDASSYTIGAAKQKFSEAKQTVSPIILDLDGDGVETTSLNNGTYFDHAGDGFAEQTGWVGKDDGLLVRDRNGDGQINDGSELFGNRTVLADGTLAANGFAALAELDTNQDGKIDASDTGYTSLRLWKDTNGDGLSTAEELQDLNTAGIQSISTTYNASSQIDSNGNEHRQTGSYTRTDGSTAAAEDVWFKIDPTYTIATDTVIVPEDIAALPNLSGYGLVRDLHQAITLDASGTLRALLGQFIAANTIPQREAAMESLLFNWSGTDAYAPDSRGAYIGDARKLYAVEAFLGEKFIQALSGINEGTPDPGPGSATYVRDAYQTIFETFYSQLLAQTELKPVLNLIDFQWDAQEQAIKGGLLAVATHLKAEIAQNDAAGKMLLADTVRTLRGLSQLDFMDTLAFRESFEGMGSAVTNIIDSSWQGLVGTNGGDNLVDSSYDNYLRGLGGHDMLLGLNGDDVLNGGAGNDTLYGGDSSFGTGNDTYVFRRGDGQDTIQDNDNTAGNVDTVQFLDVRSDELNAINRMGYDLVLSYGTNDQVRIISYFSSANLRIERFQFSDGVVWGDAEIKTRVITNGTSSNDIISGYDEGSNQIYGLEGNDYLNGGAGNDLLDGGVGNDALQGLDGNDTIVAGAGSDGLYGNAGNDVLDGGTGNDTLDGGAGNDVLVGGTENDTLNGGGLGNDTFVFRRGDGQDTIYDNDNTAGNVDTVRFLDVRSDELTAINRVGIDLVLSYGTNDQIRIISHFSSANLRIEQFQFSDGVVWEDAEIKARVVTNGTSGNDNISGFSDASNRIYGLAGNDYLYGGAQNDQLDGGVGDDSLQGLEGNDTIVGGAGNDGLYGNDGNDVLDGGAGNDTLYGGNSSGNGVGNDTYVFRRGDGQDIIYDNDNTAGNIDTVKFLDVRSDEITGINRDNYDLVFSYGSGDQVRSAFYFLAGGYRIEQFQFSDGAVWGDAEIKARVVTNGTSGNDNISGYTDSSNRIYGLEGNDYLYGGTQNDLLNGGIGDDFLQGQGGNDILEGAAGNDILTDTSGTALFNGGVGNDTITGGASAEIFLGGAGNDTYTTAAGNDIILFNKGDGQDTFATGGTGSDTISLGGGINYTDLSFSKSSSDLILKTGDTEQITFKNWYAATPSKSVANLQVIADAMAGFSAGGSDPLTDQKVESFNFAGLVGAFDAARTADAGLTSWALTNALSSFLLAGSDTAVLGGDLAYQYGHSGTLAGMGVTPALATLSDPALGASAQTLTPLSGLQTGTTRLS